jgi:hypothetical protein
MSCQNHLHKPVGLVIADCRLKTIKSIDNLKLAIGNAKGPPAHAGGPDNVFGIGLAHHGVRNQSKS